MQSTLIINKPFLFTDKASIIRLTISYLKLKDFSNNGDPNWSKLAPNPNNPLKNNKMCKYLTRKKKVKEKVKTIEMPEKRVKRWMKATRWCWLVNKKRLMTIWMWIGKECKRRRKIQWKVWCMWVNIFLCIKIIIVISFSPSSSSSQPMMIPIYMLVRLLKLQGFKRLPTLEEKTD